MATLNQQIQNLEAQLNELKAQQNNIKFQCKELAAKGARFILNEKGNEETFNMFCKFLGNKQFIDAADKGVIVIWTKWKWNKGTVELQPCGTRKGELGPIMGLDEAYNILKDLVATPDTGRNIIKGLTTPNEIEKVDNLEIGTNIFDI